MKALTWQSARKVSVEKVPKPLLTDPHDVIVKVTACAICSGSDGTIYAGEAPSIDKGFIVGHEGLGVIAEKGEAVTKFEVGDRVVISCDIACGQCEYCERQEYSGCSCTNDSKLCEKQFGHSLAALFGFARLFGNVPGSQAEFVRVPFADVNCFKIPGDVPDDKALFMSDVLSTSLHAVELGEVKEEDTVCIWGLGPIGLCVARWCKIKKAKRVIGIDLVPERLQVARDKLGIETLDRSNLTSTAVCEKLRELEPRGFDVCIEAVGFRFAMSRMHKVQRAVGLETDTPEILDECMTVARPYGRISIIGEYSGYANNFPIGKIFMKSLTVRSGTVPCQRYFKTVMKALQDNTFDPSFMVTNKISLDEAPQAYEKLFNKQDGMIKVMVCP